jgi:hypothetical protein
MKGLILKDLLLIKGNVKTFVIIVIGFLVMTLSNSSSISFIIPFFVVMMCISTFSYDEYNKWNSYAITLPGGRDIIVRSKYITTLILIITSSLISFVLALIMGNIKDNINYDSLFSTLIGGLFGISLVMSIMYPLIYKFGNEKGRLFLFIAVFITTVIGGIIATTISGLGIKPPNIIIYINKYGMYLAPGLSIIMLYISYLISLKIYKKKDF